MDSTTLSLYAPPPLYPLDYVYVDKTVIVVVKPSGLLSVPGRGEGKQDCLLARVRLDYPDALTVHRLDMETSGLIVFARGTAAQRDLSMAFQNRHVYKRYIAVVHGCVIEDTGRVEAPMIVDWPNRPRQKIDFEHGRPALSLYRVLRREADRTRLELEPVTGRSHQLRVHMLRLGHPIIGDGLYAPSPVRMLADRMLLHAAELRFAHPADAIPLSFSSTPPF
ncbi:MAG: RNA pseudouridine synthase [Azoarcus sp.]|jgi:tRNA pseudouridine32 synthase/23S rRNA pseudouridine746 synthase|nr:RNA pseudouridine synthase [Azoarcus sp.]